VTGAVSALLVILAVVVIAAAIWFFMRRSGAGASSKEPTAAPRAVPAPPLAEFDIAGGTATVSFDVPLPAGEIDEILSDLLVREAIEVVREKRRDLPVSGVSRVVARGRRDAGWHEVGSVSLETPGELPPPAVPILLPGIRTDKAFDPFEKMSELPEQAPGLQSGAGSDALGSLAEDLRIPAALQAGLRSQGIDPAGADAVHLIIGMLRLTGSTVTEKDEDTFEALSGGYRTLIRVIPHEKGDHPELEDAEVRRFAADFARSGTDRALLVTEKYCPFEVYDRERREPRARYITRERIQQFIDALVLG